MRYRKLASGCEMLRALAPGIGKVGVDRENNVLVGYVVAQLGPFKTEGRGAFNRASLSAIVGMMNEEPEGVRSRFGHESFLDDQPGKFLGRVKDARIANNRTEVRADLHFNKAAFDSPSGNLAGYVMDLVERDPGALSSSLVLQTDFIEQITKDGKAMRDDDGEPLPPIWMPTMIAGSDIVNIGEAVDDILSRRATGGGTLVNMVGSRVVLSKQSLTIRNRAGTV